MSDLSYGIMASKSDPMILKHVGEFIKHHRLIKNLSQDKVARDASISRSTLSLLERGEGVNLGSLIRVLRVLDLLHVFKEFDVHPVISPLVMAKQAKYKRSRASKKRKNATKEIPKSEW